MHRTSTFAVTAWIVLATTVSLLDSCALWRLRKDVRELDALGLIGGHVHRAQGDDAPGIVVLSASPPAGVLDSFVLGSTGSYFFTVPAGTYQIAVFIDRNRDFIYQPAAEPAAYYGAPTAVSVAAGQKIDGLDLHVGAEVQTQLNLPISVADSGKGRGREFPPVYLGDVVTLDDPRFSEANGNLGLWQPVEFLFNVGGGFFFLEEFDPQKTPVLFVHGAGGDPTNWRYLVEHLDRRKFQPWLLYYPSGLDLDALARGIGRWMRVLGSRYDFQRIIVVAHSMGGLVSRAAINQVVASGGGERLSLFVTISTPWNGYAAAASGAENSPVVMPMWVDMAPGSPFLEGIFQTPLPPGCPYYLFFSYTGHSLLLREPNDGVVALSSELVQPAQRAAQKVYGFAENHDSILTSSEVSQTLNTLLEGAVK